MGLTVVCHWGNQGSAMVELLLVWEIMKMYAGTGLAVTAVPTDFNILTCVFDGANSILGLNGVEASGNAGSNDRLGLILGNHPAGGVALTGDIAELVFCIGTIPLGDRRRMVTYLGAKYAIGVTL